MRIYIILFSLLVLSCSSPHLKVQSVEKKEINKVFVYSPEPVANLTMVNTRSKETFGTVFKKEGIPLENINPRAKEQIAVYKKNDFYYFYYFQKGSLISQKKYPAEEIEKAKREGGYLEKIQKDLGVIK